MTDNPIRNDRQRFRKEARYQRIVYEIFPDLTWKAPGSSCDWFEVALHAELSEYLPPDHPRSREVFSALMDVAEFLIRRLPTQAPCMVELSASYYTLHPPACGDFLRTRLSRSLSVVFSGVEPYNFDEPRLLTQLRTQLDLLSILGFESRRYDQSTSGSTSD
jgi:hypothetical protein